MAQLVCKLCGEGFEQSSRYDRHRAASHPPVGISEADIEKALAGIGFPKSRAEILAHVSRRTPMESAIVRAIEDLPERIYRDAGEVAAAAGAVSAATVAAVLVNIEFPRSKAELLRHAARNRSRVANPEKVLRVIRDFQERRYTDMTDVEAEAGKIL